MGRRILSFIFVHFRKEILFSPWNEYQFISFHVFYQVKQQPISSFSIPSGMCNFIIFEWCPNFFFQTMAWLKSYLFNLEKHGSYVWEMLSALGCYYKEGIWSLFCYIKKIQRWWGGFETCSLHSPIIFLIFVIISSLIHIASLKRKSNYIAVCK